MMTKKIIDTTLQLQVERHNSKKNTFIKIKSKYHVTINKYGVIQISMNVQDWIMNFQKKKDKKNQNVNNVKWIILSNWEQGII